jgi:hypothetical protein
MHDQRKGMTPRRIAVVIATAGIALAGYSSVPATKPRIEASAATPTLAAPYQDPSLAGLRPGPDADPGGDVAEYY